MIHGKPHHKSIKLYQYLVEAFLLSGGGDQSNHGYYAKQNHKPTFNRVKQAVKAAQCPKLATFETFKGCGYRKTTKKCNEPAFLSTCPLPTFDMKRGPLNHMAFSLYFFLRDVCWEGLLHICQAALWDQPAGRWGHHRPPPDLHRESHDHCQCRPEARSHGLVRPFPDAAIPGGTTGGWGRT